MYVLFCQIYSEHFASRLKMNLEIILLKHSKWVTVQTHCVTVWVNVESILGKRCVISIRNLVDVQSVRSWTNYMNELRVSKII